METVTDPQGRVVVMDEAGMQHALENHGFLIGFGVIIDVVQAPDEIYVSGRVLGRIVYVRYNAIQTKNHVLIVEVVAGPDGDRYRVITAYATDKLHGVGGGPIYAARG